MSLLSEAYTTEAHPWEKKDNPQRYDNLVHRKLRPTLNPKLGAEADDYATADLEDCEQDVIDILTMKPSSRPKARKSNGATRKPRTPGVASTSASASPAQ